MAVNETNTLNRRGGTAEINYPFSAARVKLTNNRNGNIPVTVDTGIDDDGVPVIRVTIN